MNTVYIARRIRIHPSLRDVIDTKLGKLERFFPRAVEAHVAVRREKNIVTVEVAVVATPLGPGNGPPTVEVIVTVPIVIPPEG
jgi:ribosome-associated translation inhibitor RaiA